MSHRLWRLSKPFFPWIRRRLQSRHASALWGGDSSVPQIALTFDDGPCPRDTPALLKVLARHGVTATFFVLGEKVERTGGSLLREMHAAGHQAALHGYRHRPCPVFPAATLRGELDRTRDLVAERCRTSPDEVRDVRPPFGLYTGRLLEHLGGWGYRPVMWTHVPPHWAQPAEQTVGELVRETAAGDLIVLHETRADGSPVAELVDALVPRLRERGYEFVRVDRMGKSREKSEQLQPAPDLQFLPRKR